MKEDGASAAAARVTWTAAAAGAAADADAEALISTRARAAYAHRSGGLSAREEHSARPDEEKHRRWWLHAALLGSVDEV